MIAQFLPLFLGIPLSIFILCLLFPSTKEKLIASIAIWGTALQTILLLGYTIYWLTKARSVVDLKYFVFYKEADIEIFLDFYFDHITATFSLLGSFVTFLVLIFSKYYLHRDSGFKRFFSTVMLFFFAYNMTVFAGNFETLFIGWEFLGITSFLLISFYRDRYLPVKNSLKTISLYRLGDMCLILALWSTHHLWHKNITFLQLNNTEEVVKHIAEHPTAVTFLLLMLVVASVIKSGQFPFSSWVPRAMEGPTTSSAVFYGSLAIHIGAFLLLRTYTYWHPVALIQYVIISIGVLSALIASMIARVQSTVKTQIAYASVAQIGLIFIEIALGWHTLALVHCCGNALLRTYQLLVSPSVLGYKIHDQVFNFKPNNPKTSTPLSATWLNTMYMLSLKEWNMDMYLKKFLWMPFKKIGYLFSWMAHPIVMIAGFILLLPGFFLLRSTTLFNETVLSEIHILFAFIGMLFVLVAFTEKQNAIRGWLLIILSQSYVVLSIALLNDQYEYMEIALYVAGLLLAALLGILVLQQLKHKQTELHLNTFHGYLHEFPQHGFLFLIACLAFVGLPFTPTFIGLDLMYTHIDHEEYVLVSMITISFLVLELSVLRIYARLFLGPGKTKDTPIAYRSS